MSAAAAQRRIRKRSHSMGFSPHLTDRDAEVVTAGDEWAVRRLLAEMAADPSGAPRRSSAGRPEALGVAPSLRLDSGLSCSAPAAGGARHAGPRPSSVPPGSTRPRPVSGPGYPRAESCDVAPLGDGRSLQLSARPRTREAQQGRRPRGAAGGEAPARPPLTPRGLAEANARLYYRRVPQPPEGDPICDRCTPAALSAPPPKGKRSVAPPPSGAAAPQLVPGVTQPGVAAAPDGSAPVSACLSPAAAQPQVRSAADVELWLRRLPLRDPQAARAACAAHPLLLESPPQGALPAVRQDWQRAGVTDPQDAAMLASALRTAPPGSPPRQPPSQRRPAARSPSPSPSPPAATRGRRGRPPPGACGQLAQQPLGSLTEMQLLCRLDTGNRWAPGGLYGADLSGLELLFSLAQEEQECAQGAQQRRLAERQHLLQSPSRSAATGSTRRRRRPRRALAASPYTEYGDASRVLGPIRFTPAARIDAARLEREKVRTIQMAWRSGNARLEAARRRAERHPLPAIGALLHLTLRRRGFHALKAMARSATRELPPHSDEHQSALKIQASWRGRQGKKRAVTRRQERRRAAALRRVQRCGRGLRARRQLMQYAASWLPPPRIPWLRVAATLTEPLPALALAHAVLRAAAVHALQRIGRAGQCRLALRCSEVALQRSVALRALSAACPESAAVAAVVAEAAWGIAHPPPPRRWPKFRRPPRGGSRLEAQEQQGRGVAEGAEENARCMLTPAHEVVGRAHIRVAERLQRLAAVELGFRRFLERAEDELRWQIQLRQEQELEQLDELLGDLETAQDAATACCVGAAAAAVACPTRRSPRTAAAALDLPGTPVAGAPPDWLLQAVPDQAQCGGLIDHFGTELGLLQSVGSERDLRGLGLGPQERKRVMAAVRQQQTAGPPPPGQTGGLPSPTRDAAPGRAQSLRGIASHRPLPGADGSTVGSPVSEGRCSLRIVAAAERLPPDPLSPSSEGRRAAAAEQPLPETPMSQRETTLRQRAAAAVLPETPREEPAPGDTEEAAKRIQALQRGAAARGDARLRRQQRRQALIAHAAAAASAAVLCTAAPSPPPAAEAGERRSESGEHPAESDAAAEEAAALKIQALKRGAAGREEAQRRRQLRGAAADAAVAAALLPAAAELAAPGPAASSESPRTPLRARTEGGASASASPAGTDEEGGVDGHVQRSAAPGTDAAERRAERRARRLFQSGYEAGVAGAILVLMTVAHLDPHAAAGIIQRAQRSRAARKEAARRREAAARKNLTQQRPSRAVRPAVQQLRTVEAEGRGRLLLEEEHQFCILGARLAPSEQLVRDAPLRHAVLYSDEGGVRGTLEAEEEFARGALQRQRDTRQVHPEDWAPFVLLAAAVVGVRVPEAVAEREEAATRIQANYRSALGRREAERMRKRQRAQARVDCFAPLAAAAAAAAHCVASAAATASTAAGGATARSDALPGSPPAAPAGGTAREAAAVRIQKLFRGFRWRAGELARTDSSISSLLQQWRELAR